MKKKEKLPFGPSDRSILIVCPPGLASVCETELRDLVASQPVAGRSKITHLYIDGNKITCSGLHYREVFSLCRRMTTVYGFYFLVSQRICRNKAELKNFLLSVDYEPYLVPGADISIRAESFSSTLYHERMIKEILSSVLERKGRIRDASAEDDDSGPEGGRYCRFFLHAKNDRVSLYISPAGFPLNQRLYKKNLSFIAPLREDIAAALIYRLDGLFPKPGPVAGLTVPFCGTGTFVFESLCRILNIGTGLLRDDYYGAGWEFWTAGDRKSEIKKAVEEAVLPDGFRIRAGDNDARSLSAFSSLSAEFVQCLAQNGIALKCAIEAKREDSLEGDWSCEGFSWIMLNPPYGWRLEREGGLFSRIAEKIRQAADKNPLAGFCLCPEEEDWSVLKNGLGDLYLDTVHFSLGGRQLRAAYFSKP